MLVRGARFYSHAPSLPMWQHARIAERDHEHGRAGVALGEPFAPHGELHLVHGIRDAGGYLRHLSSTVVNHINKVNSFVVAHVIFQDKINVLMSIGMVITLAGTVWYSVERLFERKREAVTAPAASEKTPLAAEKETGKGNV